MQRHVEHLGCTYACVGRAAQTRFFSSDRTEVRSHELRINRNTLSLGILGVPRQQTESHPFTLHTEGYERAYLPFAIFRFA